jgi:hypothetical protein
MKENTYISISTETLYQATKDEGYGAVSDSVDCVAIELPTRDYYAGEHTRFRAIICGPRHRRQSDVKAAGVSHP